MWTAVFCNGSFYAHLEVKYENKEKKTMWFPWKLFYPVYPACAHYLSDVQHPALYLYIYLQLYRLFGCEDHGVKLCGIEKLSDGTEKSSDEDCHKEFADICGCAYRVSGDFGSAAGGAAEQEIKDPESAAGCVFLSGGIQLFDYRLSVEFYYVIFGLRPDQQFSSQAGTWDF